MSAAWARHAMYESALIRSILYFTCKCINTTPSQTKQRRELGVHSKNVLPIRSKFKITQQTCYCSLDNCVPKCSRHSSWKAWPLKMGLIGCPKTSLTTYLRCLTLILRRSRTGTVWFYTSTSNKRAARPKLYTKSLTRDLKHMNSRLTLVRISINL